MLPDLLSAPSAAAEAPAVIQENHAVHTVHRAVGELYIVLRATAPAGQSWFRPWARCDQVASSFERGMPTEFSQRTCRQFSEIAGVER